MTPNNQERVVTYSDRVDRYISSLDIDLSRSRIKKLLQEGHIRVNATEVTPSHKVHPGDVISLVIPPQTLPEVLAEDLPLDVVYEDADCLVLNKPAGLVVHPAVGHASGTLVNALLHYLGRGASTNMRVGIVHRLDKDTSGLLVVAKNREAEDALKLQFQAHTVKKVYSALTEGHFEKPSGTIDKPIGRHPKNRQKFAVIAGGKEAQTSYRVVEEYDTCSLVEVTLLTGRTHQIRVHCASLGHPIVGDSTYGHMRNSLGLSRQFLHAKKLGFHQPTSGVYLEFESTLPHELQEALDKLTIK